MVVAQPTSRGRLDVVRPLRDRQRRLVDVEPGPERRVDALAMVEVQVPGLEVLVQVREVHARALREVPARSEVDEAERLEVRDPRAARGPAFCVDVKPRNSSAVSGIRSAPGTPAAVAICFGRLFAPSKPPPTNPLRMLVTRKMPSSSSNSVFAPSSMWSRRSLRRSTATWFSSSRVSAGSLGKRIASASARTVFFWVAVARRSTGRWRAAWPRDVAVEVRQPQATVTPSPAGVRSYRRSSCRIASSKRRARVAQVVRPRLDRERRRDDLVVQRRHERPRRRCRRRRRSRRGDAARAAPVPRRAGRARRRACRRARRYPPQRVLRQPRCRAVPVA